MNYMNTLNQIVRTYLDANGISDKFFEQYIGCNQSACSKWLRGMGKLNAEQTKRVHEFLSGKHIKTVEDILNAEE